MKQEASAVSTGSFTDIAGSICRTHLRCHGVPGAILSMQQPIPMVHLFVCMAQVWSRPCCKHTCDGRGGGTSFFSLSTEICINEHVFWHAYAVPENARCSSKVTLRIPMSAGVQAPPRHKTASGKQTKQHKLEPFFHLQLGMNDVVVGDHALV